MAITESNPVELGTNAPSFNLLDVVTGEFYNLKKLAGDKGTVVIFICNHCPFVIHINKTVVQLANMCRSKGVNFIAISSNDVQKYPADNPELMKEVALKNNYPFPYLYDESQEVAKLYDAACTPDFYILNKELKFEYHGRLDESTPGNNLPNTGQDLKFALDSLLSEKENLNEQFPSIGCGIK